MLEPLRLCYFDWVSLSWSVFCSEHTSAVLPAPASLPGPWGMQKAREGCNAWLPLSAPPVLPPVLPSVVASSGITLVLLGPYEVWWKARRRRGKVWSNLACFFWEVVLHVFHLKTPLMCHRQSQSVMQRVWSSAEVLLHQQWEPGSPSRPGFIVGIQPDLWLCLASMHLWPCPIWFDLFLIESCHWLH